MRKPQNDTPLTSTDGAEAQSPIAAGDPVGDAGDAVPELPRTTHRDSTAAAAPERKCILTGAHGDRADLIRIALSPDGHVLPDIGARAPGRGAWIAVDRAALDGAVAKGKLKGAVARAYKGAALTIPADLGALIDAAFQRSLLNQFGLAARAGALLTGADRIDTAARSGRVALLLHASDAADDGRRKRDQSWRVGEGVEGSGQQGDLLPVDRAALSIALGRDNAVHIAIIDAAWADRIGSVLKRWHRFAGSSREQGDDAAGIETVGDAHTDIVSEG